METTKKISRQFFKREQQNQHQRPCLYLCWDSCSMWKRNQRKKSCGWSRAVWQQPTCMRGFIWYGLIKMLF
eukprot:15326952-Ditylum_brightwellii.AAC.1